MSRHKRSNDLMMDVLWRIIAHSEDATDAFEHGKMERFERCQHRATRLLRWYRNRMYSEGYEHGLHDAPLLKELERQSKAPLN
jgi:hypothetical protein